MDSEIKAKWLAALRSGEYEQGKIYLRSLDNKFCCLGVLCDILAPDKWKKNNGEIWFTNSFHSIAYSTSLPPNIENIAEISHESQLILGEMNDGPLGPQFKKNFLEIADWIEKNL